jgi:cyclin-dependent kinase regulatory subunit CKS1
MDGEDGELSPEEVAALAAVADNFDANDFVLDDHPDDDEEKKVADRLKELSAQIEYSEKIEDDVYEYRWVTIPRALVAFLPQPWPGILLTEPMWRHIGIVQSRGWAHFEAHEPEANVLPFRRPRFTDPRTGEAPAHIMEKVREREAHIVKMESFQREYMRAQSVV